MLKELHDKVEAGVTADMGMTKKEDSTRISNKRIEQLLQDSRHGVTLSIDGDEVCAVLGANLQEGEAEFAKIDTVWTGGNYDRAVRYAILRAFRKLQARCTERSRQLPYNTWNIPD